MKDHLPTAREVRERLSYCPESGDFLWLKAPRAPVELGAKAGYASGNGYWRICFNGKGHLAHRLAWLWMTGSWPTGTIDHIDGDRSNNRWANLRDVSNRVNSQNLRGPRSDSSSGLIGAQKWKRPDKWTSKIRVNGKRVHLGVFTTKEEAHAAYINAKRIYHEGCTL